MIHVDTSLLIDALTGMHGSATMLRHTVARGENLQLSTIVLYEWLRGPRTPREISDQEKLFPQDAAIPFEEADARVGSVLYRSVKRARTREVDIAIAATAIRHKAKLWTLNVADFADIPGLQLYRPR